MLDAGGMSRKKLIALMGEIEVDPQTITAVVGTHMHSDHINKSTLGFCRLFGSTLHLHRENSDAILRCFDEKTRQDVAIHLFDYAPFNIGSITFEPFRVSHDAAGVTSGFRFFASDVMNPEHIGYAADLGCAPDTVLKSLKDCSILCLEANHDTDLLWKNPHRTYMHKKRVTGERGHLSNLQSAQAISRIIEFSKSAPKKIILCHLSADHNSPELALQQVGDYLKEIGTFELIAARRHEKTVFFHAEGECLEETEQLSLFQA